MKNAECNKVKPRPATAFGAAGHWPFAGGASNPPLTKGERIPFGNPRLRGLRAPQGAVSSTVFYEKCKIKSGSTRHMNDVHKELS